MRRKQKKIYSIAIEYPADEYPTFDARIRKVIGRGSDHCSIDLNMRFLEFDFPTFPEAFKYAKQVCNLRLRDLGCNIEVIHQL